MSLFRACQPEPRYTGDVARSIVSTEHDEEKPHTKTEIQLTSISSNGVGELPGEDGRF